ncbi:PAS domain S-box protein [Polaromonas hydrogenivorans]|uniref:histidine kinase n=1 Tax=Polaromonas hydrogenivorans TaxID=335476 RepID=A0AAU7LQI9_9BURK
MKLQLTLRQRLVLLLMAAMAPLFGLAIFNAQLNADAAVSRATDNLKFAVSLAASNQQRMTETVHQLLIAISQVPDIQQGQPAPCNRYLGEIKRRLPDYINLGVVGMDGYARCHALAEGSQGAARAFFGDRLYFREAVARRNFFAGEYIVGRITGKPSVTFALPVLDVQGRVSFVAYASLDLSSMARSIAAIELPAGAKLGIHDRYGTLLAGTSGIPIAIGQKTGSPVLQEAVRTLETGVRDGLDAAGQHQLWAFMPSSSQADTAFFVAVGMDRSTILEPSRRQMWLELGALALVAFLGGWMAWVLGSRTIVKPAADILEATRQLQQGRLDVRIPTQSVHASQELMQIAVGFNRMAESVQAHQAALEAELASSQAARERLKDAQSLARIGYWQIDLATQQISWSDEVYELFGIDRTQLDGTYQSFLNWIHPSDREAFTVVRDAAVRAGTALDCEFRVIAPGGRICWIHQFGRVHFNPDGHASTQRTGVIQDITQRKLAEQALIDSEQRYAELLEMVPLPMWVYDSATTRFLAVNQAAVQAYGYSAAEFLSMTIFDIRPEAEHAYLRQWLDNPLRKKALWHDLRRDASLFSVETVSQPIQYAGRAARLVVAMDKTAQDKAEKETQDYLFTLQRAADAAQAITWHQTLEGTMQEIADQARGVIGTHQAVVSLSVDGNPLQMTHALSLSEKYEPYRSLIKPADGSDIQAVVGESNRLMRMTQAELEAHPRWPGFGGHAGKHPPMRGWLAVPLIGKNGKNIGLLQLSDKYEGEFTKQDEYVALELSHLASAGLENSRLLEEISQLNAGLEQKVAERTVALARQEALFRALAEQAPQLVWTASPDGEATYFNRAWFDLMGGKLEDWTGLQWLAVIHPDDVSDIQSSWKIARASQSSYAGVRRLLAEDGSCHTMAYRGSPVLDEQGKVAFWVGIDADITEIKAIEAALRLSNQELEAFSYSVSHDLRSPLNTVDGFSRLLAKQLAQQLEGEADAKVRHYLARIQAGVAQMGQLIEDLLSLSQVTRARLHTERVDLSFMARSLLDEWQIRQPERQVTVTVESGLQAQGDRPLVRIVMENLLANAWKFTSQTAQANISVGQTFDAAGLPVFFVRDNGAGFDMAYSDKLFDPFQRLHAASEFSGTGIGLATVSRVIKRHGGRIWAESAPACGATFFFTLPQGKAYDAS